MRKLANDRKGKLRDMAALALAARGDPGAMKRLVALVESGVIWHEYEGNAMWDSVAAGLARRKEELKRYLHLRKHKKVVLRRLIAEALNEHMGGE